MQDLYSQYDCYNVNILDPIYDTKAHVATCPPQLMPVIVAEYAAMQQVLSHIRKEGMWMEIKSVFHVTIHQTT